MNNYKSVLVRSHNTRAYFLLYNATYTHSIHNINDYCLRWTVKDCSFFYSAQSSTQKFNSDRCKRVIKSWKLIRSGLFKWKTGILPLNNHIVPPTAPSMPIYRNVESTTVYWIDQAQSSARLRWFSIINTKHWILIRNKEHSYLLNTVAEFGFIILKLFWNNTS